MNFPKIILLNVYSQSHTQSWTRQIKCLFNTGGNSTQVQTVLWHCHRRCDLSEAGRPEGSCSDCKSEWHKGRMNKTTDQSAFTAFCFYTLQWAILWVFFSSRHYPRQVTESKGEGVDSFPQSHSKERHMGHVHGVCVSLSEQQWVNVAQTALTFLIAPKAAPFLFSDHDFACHCY